MAETENPEVITPNPTDSAAFTSEIFKIEVKNMPRKCGFKEARKLFNKHNINFVKLKLINPQIRNTDSMICFLTFQDEETKLSAMSIVPTITYKGKLLTCSHAKPHADPHLKRTSEENISNRQAKKAKKANREAEPFDPVKRLCPYHEIPYEKQLEMKFEKACDNMKVLKTQLVKVANRYAKDRIFIFANKNKGLPCPVEEIVPCVDRESYRNKCEFNIGYNDDDSLAVGFKGSNYVEKPNHVIDLSGNFEEKVLNEVYNIRTVKKTPCLHSCDGH